MKEYKLLLEQKKHELKECKSALGQAQSFLLEKQEELEKITSDYQVFKERAKKNNQDVKVAEDTIISERKATFYMALLVMIVSGVVSLKAGIVSNNVIKMMLTTFFMGVLSLPLIGIPLHLLRTADTRKIIKKSKKQKEDDEITDTTFQEKMNFSHQETILALKNVNEKQQLLLRKEHELDELTFVSIRLPDENTILKDNKDAQSFVKTKTI